MMIKLIKTTKYFVILILSIFFWGGGCCLGVVFDFQEQFTKYKTSQDKKLQLFQIHYI